MTKPVDDMDKKWYAWCLSEWEGMPEFVMRDLNPWKQLIVNFASDEDMQAFAQLVGQQLTKQTSSIWYPENEEINVMGKMRYVEEAAL